MTLGKYGDMQANNVEKMRRVWEVKYRVEKFLKKFPRKNGLCVLHCGHFSCNEGIVTVSRAVQLRNASL